MKRLFPFLLLLSLVFGLTGAQGPIEGQHSGNALRSSLANAIVAEEGSKACHVYGKIKFVDNFADYQVEVVDHHEDLRVEYVDNFADDPGKWEIVEHHEDYKIEIVDHHEDFTIKEVDNFPGCD